MNHVDELINELFEFQDEKSQESIEISNLLQDSENYEIILNNNIS